MHPLFQQILDPYKFREAATPRFPATSCSQCGCDTGPGEHGHSACETHSAYYADMLGLEIDLRAAGIYSPNLREIARFIAKSFKLEKRT